MQQRTSNLQHNRFHLRNIIFGVTALAATAVGANSQLVSFLEDPLLTDYSVRSYLSNSYEDLRLANQQICPTSEIIGLNFTFDPNSVHKQQPLTLDYKQLGPSGQLHPTQFNSSISIHKVENSFQPRNRQRKAKKSLANRFKKNALIITFCLAPTFMSLILMYLIYKVYYCQKCQTIILDEPNSEVADRLLEFHPDQKVPTANQSTTILSLDPTIDTPKRSLSAQTPPKRADEILELARINNKIQEQNERIRSLTSKNKELALNLKRISLDNRSQVKADDASLQPQASSDCLLDDVRALDINFDQFSDHKNSSQSDIITGEDTPQSMINGEMVNEPRSPDTMKHLHMYLAKIKPQSSEISLINNAMTITRQYQVPREKASDLFAYSPAVVINHTPGTESIQFKNFNQEKVLETGRFAQQFEIIGDTDGVTYEVKHKLTGNIYSVKKVQMRLDNGKDLAEQLKSQETYKKMLEMSQTDTLRYYSSWFENLSQEELATIPCNADTFSAAAAQKAFPGLTLNLYIQMQKEEVY